MFPWPPRHTFFCNIGVAENWYVGTDVALCCDCDFVFEVLKKQKQLLTHRISIFFFIIFQCFNGIIACANTHILQPTFESDFVDLRADTSHVKKINFTERATDQANKVHRAVVVLTPPQNNEGDDYAYDDDDDYVDEGTYDNGEDIADEDSLWWIDPVDYDRWTQADRYGASCPDKWTHVTTYSVDFHGGGKGNRRFPGVKIWVLWDHDIATHTPDDGVFETQIVRCAPTVVARGDITVSKAELL